MHDFNASRGPTVGAISTIARNASIHSKVKGLGTRYWDPPEMRLNPHSPLEYKIDSPKKKGPQKADRVPLFHFL